MQDLSGLCHGLTGGSSMNSSNMISDPPPFGAPGSYSEATANEPVGRPGGVDYPPLDGDRPAVVSGDEAPRGGDPFAASTPGGWRVGSDDAGRTAGGWVNL